MSCHRLALRLPGTLVWASSSTSATSGRRARMASTSISSNAVIPVVDVVGEARPRGRRSCCSVFGPADGSRRSRPPRRCRARGAASPRRAWRTSCPRPAPRRGRSAACPVPWPGCLRSGPALVEGEVELEHVHGGLTEDAELTAGGVVVDEIERRQPRASCVRRRPGWPGAWRWRPRCRGRDPSPRPSPRRPARPRRRRDR